MFRGQKRHPITSGAAHYSNLDTWQKTFVLVLYTALHLGSWKPFEQMASPLPCDIETWIQIDAVCDGWSLWSVWLADDFEWWHKKKSLKRSSKGTDCVSAVSATIFHPVHLLKWRVYFILGVDSACVAEGTGRVYLLPTPYFFFKCLFPSSCFVSLTCCVYLNPKHQGRKCLFPSQRNACTTNPSICAY